MKTSGIPAFPWKLLERVSRSFYLSLRLLPSGIREPISLAYLLARLSDTEVDGVESEAEQELLERKAAILALLEEAPLRDRIEAVWSTIREGQDFDTRRFHPAPQPPLDPTELDRYTYLVAGCVGEFWTRVCGDVLPGFADRAIEEMIPLGIRFGKGLQLVNILRDRASDARRGRIYLEASRVPETLILAREHLAAARSYCAAVRPLRLHAACLLPCLLAAETLDLIEANPGQEGVKVPRKRVKVLFLLALTRSVFHQFQCRRRSP